MNTYKMPSLEALMVHDEEMYGYLINAYLQYAKSEISNLKLHPVGPHTTDLMENCDFLIDAIASFEESMPKKLVKFDHKKWKLIYEKIHFDDMVDQMYIKLVAIKKEVFTIDVQLQNIFKEAEKLLNWELVGLPVGSKDCGLLFAHNTLKNQVKTYSFSVSQILAQNKVNYVHTDYIDTWQYSENTNYSTKKYEYIKTLKQFQSLPLCLSVTWNKQIPLETTVLPIIHQALPKTLEKMKLW